MTHEDLQHLSPTQLEDLVIEMYNYAADFPNWLAEGTPYAKGYKDASMLQHTNMLNIIKAHI